MITVSDKELAQVEYLIQQSKQGNHVLFEPDTIRRAFESVNRTPCADGDAYSVEHHLERLILQPTISQKRAYLESLDPRTYELVVVTYFNIVENNLFESDEVRH